MGTIHLEPLPNASGDYIGHLTVTVVSSEETPGELSVSYIQEGVGRFDALAETAASPVQPIGPSADGKITARPDRPVPIQLKFTLSKGHPASWLDGTLLIELERRDRAGQMSSTTLLVPVKAEFQALTDIAFQPDSLTAQMTGGDFEGSTTVRLTGAGAQSLLERDPPFTDTVQLGNGEGNGAELTLGELRKAGNGDVVGKISVDDADPGEYKGTLTLGAGTGAPSLPITLHSRSCLLWAIFLVPIGSLIGGLLPTLTGTGRERALMLNRLKNAIERFEAKYKSGDNTPHPLWDMTLKMGPQPWLEQKWSSVEQVDGVAGLYANLRMARSKEDIEDLSPRVDAAIEEIARWLLVFDSAVKLREVFNRADVPMRGDRDWFSTGLAKDTEALLNALRHEPAKSVDEADQKATQCIEQYVWHFAVVEAWTKVARAQADRRLPDDTRSKLSALDFAPIVDPDPPASKRKVEEMTELEKKLADLVHAAGKLVPTLDRYADPPTAADWAVFVASAEIGEPEPSRPDLEDSEASRPWGGLDARTELFQDSVRRSVQPDPAGAEGESTLEHIFILDWGVTIVLALGTVFAYVAPLYTSTWGTRTDVLTALAAGFGTQAVVQWGAMPITRSIRRKKADGNEGPPASPPPGPQPAKA